MIKKTFTHTFPRRTAICTIVEGADFVDIKIRMSAYGEHGDTAEFARWLLPILEQYDSDPRPTRMDNPHSGQTLIATESCALIIPPNLGNQN